LSDVGFAMMLSAMQLTFKNAAPARWSPPAAGT
jgi:hypothetical protein